jgi:hypothetical protein
MVAAEQLRDCKVRFFFFFLLFFVFCACVRCVLGVCSAFCHQQIAVRFM